MNEGILVTILEGGRIEVARLIITRVSRIAANDVKLPQLLQKP